MCVRTDENPEVFVLCGFCRPEARRSGSVPARFPGRNLMFFARGKNRNPKKQKAGGLSRLFALGGEILWMELLSCSGFPSAIIIIHEDCGGKMQNSCTIGKVTINKPCTKQKIKKTKKSKYNNAKCWKLYP